MSDSSDETLAMNQISVLFEKKLSNFMEHQAKLVKVPSKINGYKEPIKRQQRYMEHNEKLHKVINDYEKSEVLMLENISICKSKVDNLQMEIEKLTRKLEERKKRDHENEKWAEFLGFRCYMKDNNLLILEFCKLPIKEYDTTFIFEIEYSKSGHFKVLRTKPDGCLDLDHINLEASQYETNSNLLWIFICLIRRALVTKYSA